MFLGTSTLAYLFGVHPHEEETVISQFARYIFGGPMQWFYYVVQASTAAILILAANTAFADFPRLRACSPATVLFRNNLAIAAINSFSRTASSFSPFFRASADSCFCGRHEPADPALCGRRVSVIYAVAGRHGAALVKGPAGRDI